jgi:hypothetical protein
MLKTGTAVGAALSRYAFPLQKMKRGKESKVVERCAAAILQDHPELTRRRPTVDWAELKPLRLTGGSGDETSLVQRP